LANRLIGEPGPSLAIATFFGLVGVYVVNIEIRPGAVPVL